MGTDKRHEIDPVLASEWLPIAYAHDIADQPIQVTILEERVVLFRTDDGIKAFKDLCIHRGAELSLGKVVNNCLVCPYHGWEYNQEGKCVKIPQQPARRVIPPKAKAVVFPCMERYGLVWVKLNKEETMASTLPEYEEFDDPSFKTVYANPHIINAAAPRVVENFLDVSHLAFVHEGSLGDSDHAEIPDYKVHWKDNRYVSDVIPVYADPDGTGKWSILNYTFEILRPLLARLKKVNEETNEIFSMLFAVQPQAERKSKIFALVSRNYDLETPDQYYIDFQQLIIDQDTAVVESQRPEELPLELQAELHLPPDRVSIAYRRWLSELGVTYGSEVKKHKQMK
ncbi:aromatic ring-hydroxylating oxygenase subunit alpha [Terrilactibacillus laevilacticus]|uniref:aromatic ring-hydroxylating dioxygenase subunit alpha n=1 Tax=Terrilactibacillus laevilacticus TaxID=1380157 RepID=UPI001147425C|nr:aromatic ring-hydroxylating dioxygenase subunit alpha [Terrilactibacillus laevilacticus]